MTQAEANAVMLDFVKRKPEKAVQLLRILTADEKYRRAFFKEADAIYALIEPTKGGAA